MVTLIHPQGTEIEFTKEHAEKLMSMPENGGWKYKKEPKQKNAENKGTDKSTAEPT